MTSGARRVVRPDSSWIVVAVLSVTETVSWGIIYYGFPVFLRSMEESLHASRVAVTGAFSVGLAVSAIAAIPVGRWLDRHGPRVLMTLGSCLGTILLLGWSRIESLGALYAIWTVMGLAMAATLYEPAFAAVVQLFTRHRDRALLVVTLCAGLASTIFMPLAAWLLGRLGWRGALVTLTVILGAITIPLHAFLLPGGPGRRDEHVGVASSGRGISGISLHTALRTPVFWALTVAFVVGSFATVSVTVHMIPFLVDRGYSAPVAAAAIGWMGAMQLPGRLFFVPIAAWLGPQAVTSAVFVAQAGGIALLALLPWLPGLWPVIVLSGAANGMSTLSRATTVSEVFGRENYASISGAIALGANGARAIAPVGASLLLVLLGSYERLFWTLAGALVVVGITLLSTDAAAASAGARDG